MKKAGLLCMATFAFSSAPPLTQQQSFVLAYLYVEILTRPNEKKVWNGPDAKDAILEVLKLHS